MAKHVMLVSINAAAGRDAEFNDWYDKVHLKEVLALPGFVAAQRFKLSDAQMPWGDPPPHKYLTVYEIDGDPAALIAKLTSPETAKNMTVSDSSDVNTAVVRMFTAVGPYTKAAR